MLLLRRKCFSVWLKMSELQDPGAFTVEACSHLFSLSQLNHGRHSRRFSFFRGCTLVSVTNRKPIQWGSFSRKTGNQTGKPDLKVIRTLSRPPSFDSPTEKDRHFFYVIFYLSICFPQFTRSFSLLAILSSFYLFYGLLSPYDSALCRQ